MGITPAIIAASAIGAGSSLASGAIGASAANSAAGRLTNAANGANNLLSTALPGATNILQGNTNLANQALAPWLTTGGNASLQLASLMDPTNMGSILQGFKGSTATPGFNPTGSFQGVPTFQGIPQFTAPDPSKVLDNPSIQFQLQQGEKAIQNNAAATGTLGAGTLKDLNNYAQGVASTGYNNLFNQSLQTQQSNYGQALNTNLNQFNQALQTSQTQFGQGQQTWQDQYTKALQDFQNQFGIFQDTRNAQLGALNTAMGQGLSAAGVTSGNYTGLGSQLAQLLMGTAGQQGQNLLTGAGAAAGATIAGGNSWMNALNGLGQNASNAITLSQLQQFLASRTPNS